MSKNKKARDFIGKHAKFFGTAGCLALLLLISLVGFFAPVPFVEPLDLMCLTVFVGVELFIMANHFLYLGDRANEIMLEDEERVDE